MLGRVKNRGLEDNKELAVKEINNNETNKKKSRETITEAYTGIPINTKAKLVTDSHSATI